MIFIVNGRDDRSTAAETINFSEQALLKQIAVRRAAVYPSVPDLTFELRMRSRTIEAARALNASGASFEIFATSRCNPQYWILEPNGAFRIRPDVLPSDAIRDIFANGHLYGFECATAMIIVLYKAALDSIGEAAYNRLFANTYLYHWNVDRDLGLTTLPESRFIPGDILYFDNPEVDPSTPQWQGENVVYMGGDLYYGHGIGITNAAKIIETLNAHRRPGATQSAFMLQQATRPDYLRLSQAAASVPEASPMPGLPGGWPYRANIGRGLYIFG
jgi:protein-glutamine gamma-glutamyltransferase